MTLVAELHPITVKGSCVDDSIVNGELDGAIEQWDTFRAGCSDRAQILNNLIEIRMRVEYRLQHRAETLKREATAVQETLREFLERAKTK